MDVANLASSGVPYLPEGPSVGSTFPRKRGAGLALRRRGSWSIAPGLAKESTEYVVRQAVDSAAGEGICMTQAAKLEAS